MYCQAKIAERLDIASHELGWPLEYHSLAEIDKFAEHLRQSEGFNDDGDLVFSRELVDWEVRWIRNERALCSCDAGYWLTRYAHIKDDANIIHRFGFRVPQKLYFDIISDLEARELAIELLVLKARQLGVSTVTELLITHRIVFSQGVNAIIASADRTKSAKMSSMAFLAFDRMPWWMKPKVTRRVESDQGMLVLGDMDSGVSIQHGAQMSGIARGTTPTVYHLSEVASFTNPEQQIDAALLKAVHAHPNVFGVLESTAEGDRGWWPDTWRFCKSNPGTARQHPLFLPWFCGTDLYPTPTWIRGRPIPAAWRPISKTAEHVAKAELYVRSHQLLSRHLGARWRMPREQQWYWEVNYLEHREKGMEGTWFQEMAGDDIEAFQSSEESVFGREVIASVESARTQAITAYGITGQSIEDRHEPLVEDIDYTRERRVAVYTSQVTNETYRWEMIPLRFDWTPDELTQMRERYPDDFKLIPENKLLVFHEPQAGIDYSIGVDTSNGIGQDATVIAVCARGGTGMPDTQVAEFRSRTISHVEAFAQAMAIAAYYARFMPDTTSFREPYMSIEQIRAVGDTCQLQMRKMGYRRFHKFVRFDSAKMSKAKATRIGWFTTPWSRPILCDGFVISVQNGWYRVNSPWTIDEMRHWETHYTGTGKAKMEHATGENDDGIFANAMATFCPNDLRAMTDRSAKKFVQAAQALPAIDLAPYQGSRVSTRPDRQPVDNMIRAVEELRRYEE